jgi:hypothetical protein
MGRVLILGSSRLGGEQVLVGRADFADGMRPALLAVLPSGEVFERLSSNHDDLGRDEVAVRRHSLGERDYQRLLNSGLPVFDTGREIESGFVRLPVWKLTETRSPNEVT